LLRQSTELWERQTQTVTTLNNGAIVSFTLFQLTGDPADAEQGAVKLQRAVSMSPTDSIITINAATSLSDAAFRDLLGDRVDVRLLKLPGDHEYLSYLYDDSAELEKYVQLVKQHTVLAEALSYYQRVQLLAPKSTEGFQLPSWVHRLVRDDEALREVHRRVMQSEFDTSDSDSQRQRFISGQDDQKSLLQLNEALKRHYETLAGLGERAKDATFAVAAGRLIETELSTSFFGRTVDFEGLLQLAEVAYAAAPSQGSRSTLIAALLALADQKFRNQDANYAQLAQQYERSLGPAIQIPVVLQRDAVFRELALGNEHLQRGLSLTVEQVEKIPEWLEPWHWALIRHSRPELADEWGARLAANDVLRMQREIAFQLAPGNSYWAYSLAWLDECSGDTQQAESVLETCRQHGTPLPE
jgi:hypothetical protein